MCVNNKKLMTDWNNPLATDGNFIAVRGDIKTTTRSNGMKAAQSGREWNNIKVKRMAKPGETFFGHSIAYGA